MVFMNVVADERFPAHPVQLPYSWLTLFNLFRLAPRPVGHRLRGLLVDSLPLEPLGLGDPEEIEIFIPTSQRDMEVLPHTISALIKNVRNPISRIVISAPEDFELDVTSFQVPIEKVLDTDILSANLRDRVLSAARRWEGRIGIGWFVQQALKFEFVRSSLARGVLVCDAETILVAPRNFIDRDGVQLLAPSYEFHLPYERHFRSFFGVSAPPKTWLSFVTHHQLMIPAVVRKMFPSESILASWMELGNPLDPSSPVSEYHSYGRYLTHFFPESYKLGGFRYSTGKRSQLVLSAHNRSAGRERWSVSYHSYAQ